MNRRSMFTILPAGLLSLLYASPMKAILPKDDENWIIDKNNNVIHKPSALSYEGCILVMCELRKSYDGTVGNYAYPPNAYSVRRSKNYSKSFWEPKLTKCQSEIDMTREWAEGLQEKQIRNCYLYWINYDQRKLDTAKNELEHRTKYLISQAYLKDSEDKHARLEEFRKKVTIPTPPRSRS